MYNKHCWIISKRWGNFYSPRERLANVGLIIAPSFMSFKMMARSSTIQDAISIGKFFWILRDLPLFRFMIDNPEILGDASTSTWPIPGRELENLQDSPRFSKILQDSLQDDGFSQMAVRRWNEKPKPQRNQSDNKKQHWNNILWILSWLLWRATISDVGAAIIDRHRRRRLLPWALNKTNIKMKMRKKNKEKKMEPKKNIS